MNIILKQDDIQKAVRMYVERQGIHLFNKTLDITFNMGRGDNGLSASLTIEDITIPGFTDTPDEDDAAKAAGPSEAVKAMAATHVAKDPIAKASKAEVKAEVAKADVAAPAATAVVAAPVVADPAPAEVIGNGVLAEAAQALLVPADVAVAAVATPATEAAAAEAKPTTSLFG